MTIDIILTRWPEDHINILTTHWKKNVQNRDNDTGIILNKIAFFLHHRTPCIAWQRCAVSADILRTLMILGGWGKPNMIWKHLWNTTFSTLTNTVEKDMHDGGQVPLLEQQQCRAAEVERRQIAMLFRRNMISTKLGNMECAEPTNTAAPPAQLRSPQ